MYRWVDHTAELELEIEAESEAAVFADALAAVAELLGEDAIPPASEGERPEPPEEVRREEVRREVELASADRAALLADWVDELVYLAEVEGFVPARLAELKLGETWLRASVAGRLGEPRPLVKAVTRHRLALEPAAGGGWRARLVLDV